MKLPKLAEHPKQEVERGDCVEKMNKLAAHSVDLLIADSPYNIGKSYDGYDDNKPHNTFMTWMKTWLGATLRVLANHGSMFVFAPDEWVSDVDVFCRHELKLHRRGWICWVFTFGIANQKNFSRAHTHILYYTKAKTQFTFNADAVRVPSARQLVYNDKRQNATGKLPDNFWMLLREQMEPYMTPDKDVWLESRVCGTFKERRRHSSNQIPVPLLERIVLACSNSGDLVLDPFSGTASTGVACALHNRNFLGYDISSTCVTEGRERIKAALRKMNS